MTRLTVKQATFDFLRSVGVTKVFGNPGSTEMPFLSDWPDDIDYVLGLQEASVVGMADGYAQATRNAGIVNLHSAAGTGHGLGALYTAHRNRTPLVVIAGQQSRSILPLQPFLYAERASEFPQPYVKYSVEPARAADVPAAIARAYYTAMQPPCGPTFVSVPADDWLQPAHTVSTRAIAIASRPEDSVVVALAQRIAMSKSPAFVVGPAIDRANAVDAMVALATRARALVYVSPFSARCSFPETHALFAGFLHAAPAQLSDALRAHDLIIVIGAPIFTFHVEGHAAIFDGTSALVQMTDEPEQAAITPRGDIIVCGIARGIAELHGALKPPRRPKPPLRTIAAPPDRSHPMTAEHVMHRLSQTMPSDAAVVEEAPSHRLAMQKHWPMRGADSFYTMASGGLGFALPAAVGIALTGRRTLCLIGDGSAMYSVQALWTAARRRLPLVVVVLNNEGYGAMRSFSRILQMRGVPGLDLPGLDIAKLGEGFGCSALRVSRAEELERALASAFGNDGPVVIDVAVDHAVPMLYAGKE